VGQRVNHLFFVSDVMIGISWIGEDVRSAAARVGAPTQNALRGSRRR